MSETATDLVKSIKDISTKLGQKFLEKKGAVTEIFPDDMKPAEIHEALMSSVALLEDMQGMEGRVKTNIGRLLQLATANPEVYESQGMKKFEDYIQFIKKVTGFSRTNLFDSRKLMEKWSKLPVEEIQSIGYTKLMIAGQYTNHDDPGHKKVLKMAEKAETADVFRQQIEEMYSDPKGSSGDVLRLVGSKADIKDLTNWLDDVEVEAYCGSGKPVKKILRAFEEMNAQVQAAAKAAAKSAKGKKDEAA